MAMWQFLCLLTQERPFFLSGLGKLSQSNMTLCSVLYARPRQPNPLKSPCSQVCVCLCGSCHKCYVIWGGHPHTSTCYAKFCRWALSPRASNLSVLTGWFLFSSSIHCIAHLAHCCCFLLVVECVVPNSKVTICVLSALIRVWPASCGHLGGKYTTRSC